MTTSPPSPTSITRAQFAHFLSTYPLVLQRVYEAKIKDTKKLAQALEDDAWRYGGLVKLVEGRRGKDGSVGGWLEKAELEKLVRWKITHGTNRPFLPAQIRKNEPAAVKSATTAGFTAPKDPKRLKDPTDLQFPTEALTALTTLTGVGPATATLLLSVHDPVDAPFFQDELYHWLCADGDGAAAKLKYNMKEYKGLFEKVGGLRQRLAGAGAAGVRADEVEKVGFVVGHLDVLGAKEKEQLTAVLGKEKGAKNKGPGGDVGEEEEEEEEEEKEEGLEKKVPVADKEIVEKDEAPANGDNKAVPSTKRKRKATTTTDSSTPTKKSAKIAAKGRSGSRRGLL